MRQMTLFGLIFLIGAATAFGAYTNDCTHLISGVVMDDYDNPATQNMWDGDWQSWAMFDPNFFGTQTISFSCAVDASSATLQIKDVLGTRNLSLPSECLINPVQWKLDVFKPANFEYTYACYNGVSWKILDQGESDPYVNFMIYEQELHYEPIAKMAMKQFVKPTLKTQLAKQPIVKLIKQLKGMMKKR